MKVDVVMAGTFAAWRLGTLQARALPLAQQLHARGVRCAIVTVPWDLPTERGVIESVGHIPVLNTHHASLVATPVSVRQQVRLIESLQPAAVHVFKPKGFGMLSAAILARSIPVVVDTDDWEGDGGWNRIGGYNLLQRRVFHWQEQTLLREAVGVTAASVLLYERARQKRRGTARDRVWHVPNGLQHEWLDQLGAGDRAAAPRDNAPTIVVYSRFAEFTPDWLPRFVRSLAERTSDRGSVRVVILGNTGMPVSAAGHVSVEDKGYAARSTIVECLRGASLAVYPYEDSLVTRSKNSVKLLELMAAGCPVIASDVGDVSATLGGAGLLIPGDYPDMFAAAAVQLLGRPGVLGRMREAGPGRVRESFTSEALAARLHQIYQSLGIVAE